MNRFMPEVLNWKQVRKNLPECNMERKKDRKYKRKDKRNEDTVLKSSMCLLEFRKREREQYVKDND